MRYEKATVSSKGQVVIPRAIRKILGIHAGTELIFALHDDKLEIKPIKRSIEMFFGCCKENGKERAMTVEEMDEAIMQAVIKNDERKK